MKRSYPRRAKARQYKHPLDTRRRRAKKQSDYRARKARGETGYYLRAHDKLTKHALRRYCELWWPLQDVGLSKNPSRKEVEALLSRVWTHIAAKLAPPDILLPTYKVKN